MFPDEHRAQLNLRLGDLDLDVGVASVMGKGRRPRSYPFGAKAALALDRYLRLRGSYTLKAPAA